MVSAVADGAVMILAADLSYYHIADRLGLTLTTLTERFATSDQIGILAKERIDGKPALLEAFKLLKVKAAQG
jgi:HK97 family phage major capsid protein